MTLSPGLYQQPSGRLVEVIGRSRSSGGLHVLWRPLDGLYEGKPLASDECCATPVPVWRAVRIAESPSGEDRLTIETMGDQG